MSTGLLANLLFALKAMIFIVTPLVLIEYLIIWVVAFKNNINYRKIDEPRGRYIGYFMGSGYYHVGKIFKDVWSDLTKLDQLRPENSIDPKRFIISKYARDLGNYDRSHWLVRFILSFLYIPLVTIGIIEVVFSVPFGIVLLLIFTAVQSAFLMVGNIINFLLLVVSWAISRFICKK